MIAPRTLSTGGQLALLGLAALFAATTVNGFLAMALRPRPVVDLSPPEPPAEAPRKRSRADYAPITQRDVFNPPKPEIAAPAPVSDLKAKLLGTAPGHGIESFAILEDQITKKQDLYRIGDAIQGRTVERIEWDRVILKNGEREETLQIVETPGLGGAASVAPAAGGIQAVSETEYQIDRSEVEQAMQNLNQLFTQMRAVPHFEEGRANGFRLFAIRRDSVFERIGLKNGDIVTAINGTPLTDPAKAMELIQQLKDERRIAVEVVRNRQPTTLTYEIR
jgi:general secretion pathway protein C